MKYIHSLLALVIFIAGCGSVKYSNPAYSDASGIYRFYPDQKSLSLEEMKALWRVEAEGYVLTFHPNPEYPRAGQNVKLEIDIRQNVKEGLVPVSRAKAGCRTHIPSVTGHVHFSASQVSLNEKTPGVYAGSAVFSMGQDWEVDFNIIIPGGRSIGVDFPVKVNGAAENP